MSGPQGWTYHLGWSEASFPLPICNGVGEEGKVNARSPHVYSVTLIGSYLCILRVWLGTTNLVRLTRNYCMYPMGEISNYGSCEPDLVLGKL